MNNTVKMVLTFVGGLAVGALGGVLATRAFYQKRSDKAIEEIRDYYAEEVAQYKDVASEATKQYIETVYGPNPNADPPVVASKRQDWVRPEPVAYHKIGKTVPMNLPIDEYAQRLRNEYHDEDEKRELDDVYDPDEDMHPEDEDDPPPTIDDLIPPDNSEDDPPPYIITQEEFLFRDSIFEKDHLTYWMVDGVLSDDDDDDLDIDDLIGEENLQVLLESDDNVIFVRNFECGMEWEIEKVNESFEEHLKKNQKK